MTRIIIFAKAPFPGLSKTRLAPALGNAGAARLAGGMLHHTLDAALNSLLTPVELRTEPAIEHEYWRGVILPDSIIINPQGTGDLGARLLMAATEALIEDSTILLIGTDCPELTAERLQLAARQLQSHDAVIQPARDGGYVLLGLRCCEASLFSDMAWSSSGVFAETCRRLDALGWSYAVLEALRDIDEPGDLQHLPLTLLEFAHE